MAQNNKRKDLTTLKQYLPSFKILIPITLIAIIGLIILIIPQNSKPSTNHQPIGLVSDKSANNGRYSITVTGYGNYLISKDQYPTIKVGQSAPKQILNQK